MARNGSGTYSLPNAARTAGTTITAADENDTRNDLATELTDSLCRSNKGGMLGPLGLTDGAVGAPSLKFNDEATSGLYRAGAGDVRAAILGVERAKLTAAGLDVAGKVAATGAVSGTTGTFTGAVSGTTGTFSAAVSGTSGTFSAAVSGTTGTFTGVVKAADGVVGGPGLTFGSEATSGLYRAGAGDVRLAVSGADVVKATAAGLDITGKMAATGAVSGTTGTFTGVVKAADGVVGGPGLSFGSEAASGLYRAGAGDVRLAVSGADVVKATSAGADVTGKMAATGAVSGTTGTFSGAVSGTTGTFSAAVSGTTGTFTGAVSAPNTWQRVVATSDTACSSDSTAENIAGLTFACATSKKYLVRAHLFVYAAATTTGLGINAKATGAPTTSTFFLIHVHPVSADTGPVLYLSHSAPDDTPAVTSATMSSTAGAPGIDLLDGYFVTTGTGTFQLCLISEVNTSAVTVKAGSYLEWSEFA